MEKSLLGVRLKELRTNKGITQEELGKIIGVTTSMIGMYEISKRKPSIGMLTGIADYFNVTTDYLIGRDKQTNLEQRVLSLEKEISELKEQMIEQPSFEETRDSTVDIFIEVLIAQRKLWQRKKPD